MRSFRINDTEHLHNILNQRAGSKRKNVFSDVFFIPGDRGIETNLEFDGKYYVLEFTAFTPHVTDMETFMSQLNNIRFRKKLRIYSGGIKRKFLPIKIDTVRKNAFYIRIGENSTYSYGLSIHGRPGDYSVELFCGDNGTSAQEILNEWEFTRNITTLEEIANYLFQPFLVGHEQDHTYSVNLRLED
jgi:hypothetical protein